MCVIIVKEKNQEKPSEKMLKQAWEGNPDGAGVMWNRKGKVNIMKGFMTFDSFWKQVKDLPNDSTIVYHFRIATHGAKDARGTHPFPITDKYKMLQEKYVKTSIGVAHNGIISMCSFYDKEHNAYDLSDTQLFIRDYLSQIAKIPNWLQNQNIMKMIERLVASKLVILEANGKVHYIGNFVKVQGYNCSNDYFDIKNRYHYNYSYNYNLTDYKAPAKTAGTDKKLDLMVIEEDILIRVLLDGAWYLPTSFDSLYLRTDGTLVANNEEIPLENYEITDNNGEELEYEEIEKMIEKKYWY